MQVSSLYKSMIMLIFMGVIMCAASISSYACSTFAVYADRTYYGMNWDYYANYDATIYIKNVNDMKVFVVYDQDGNDFTGMNTKGLLATKIMEYPSEDFGVLRGLANNKLQRIEMKDVFREALFNFSNIEQVNNYLKDKIIFYSQTKMHDMFADMNGNAQIVEVGKNKNMITPIQDKFLIMSNFTYYYFKDTPYKKISAKGADRYIAGYDYVLKNINEFNVDKGIEMLEAMKCVDTSFYTLGSFLYDPDTNSVYIAVNRDFDKIWKVSIQDETVETYKGFNESMKIKIEQSIKLSDLKKLSEAKKSSTKNLIIGAVLLLVAVVLILFANQKKRRKPSESLLR